MEHGLDRDTLADAIAAGERDRLDRLAADLLARAEAYRRRGRERMDELAPHLGTRERLALEGLVRVYEGLHGDFHRDFAARLAALPGLEAGHRASAFGDR